MAKVSLSALLCLASGFAFVACGDDGDLPNIGNTGGGGNARPGGQPGGIGDRCASNADCSSGLCLRADDTGNPLTVGTPPSGLCTRSCGSDADCANYEQGTICVPFSTSASYCAQSCTLGQPTADEHKCFERPEFSCQPLLADSAPKCTTNDQCQAGTFCFDGTCALVPVCLPRCGSDQDCPSGRFCDFSLGECVTQKPAGKGLGETCNPTATTEECRGQCVDLDKDGTGECLEFCTLGADAACGYADTKSAPVQCLAALDFGTPLGAFDDGVCAKLCKCNADCVGEQKCFAEPGLAAFCTSNLPGATPVEKCPAGGMGGAGGAAP